MSINEELWQGKYASYKGETYEQGCKRVSNALGLPELESILRKELFSVGGRVWYGAGKAKPYMSNCALFGVEDSKEGWASLLHRVTLALTSGMGIGVSYDAIRPFGSPIKGTNGTASGSVSLMKMINEVARHIMQGGSRRCLPKGTKVFTTEGVVNIEDCQAGMFVYTPDGVKPITNVFEQGMQQLVTIETQLGELKCTPNHRVAVMTGVDTYEFKRADELTEDDILCVGNGDYSGDEASLPAYVKYETLEKMSTTYQDVTIPELDTGIAWLFGLFHGDGYVNQKRVAIACDTTKTDIIYEAKTQLERFGTRVHIREKKGEGCVNVETYSTGLAYYMQQFKTANTTIDIPSFIWCGNKEIKAAYVAGLFDADGSNSIRSQCISSIYLEYLNQVQILLFSIGIPTRIRLSRKAQGNWKALYHLNISGQLTQQKWYDVIDRYSHKPITISTRERLSISYPNHFFTSEERRQYLNTRSPNNWKNIPAKYIPNTELLPVHVKSVTLTEEYSKTYDIEVKDVHCFYANGYLVHNSACYASLHWQHKDIPEFVNVKQWDEEYTRLKAIDALNYPAPLDLTNISVRLDNEFIIAYNNGDSVAHQVWDKATRNMFSASEPGLQFDADNKVYRNGCSEVVSEYDNDSCILGSVNLANINHIDELEEVIKWAMLALLRVRHQTLYPTEEMHTVATQHPRVGLGVMGLHNWLIQRGLPYEWCNELEELFRALQDMATHYGSYWCNKYGYAPLEGHIAHAPTGSISRLFGGVSSGIEPIFALAYKWRYMLNNELREQVVIDSNVETFMQQGIDVTSIEDAYSLAASPDGFKRRVEMQAHIQTYCDNAISSTINLPEWGSAYNNETTLDTYRAILLAYLPYLRGITVYANGSRSGQPLTAIPIEEALREKHETDSQYSNCSNGACAL